jgi:hypothetical protein
MDQEEFLLAAQSYAQITPFEVSHKTLLLNKTVYVIQVEILFRLCELAHPGARTVSLRDIERIDPERLKRVSYITRLTDIKAVDSPAERGFITAVCFHLQSGRCSTVHRVSSRAIVSCWAVWPVQWAPRPSTQLIW